MAELCIDTLCLIIARETTMLLYHTVKKVTALLAHNHCQAALSAMRDYSTFGASSLSRYHTVYWFDVTCSLSALHFQEQQYAEWDADEFTSFTRIQIIFVLGALGLTDKCDSYLSLLCRIKPLDAVGRFSPLKPSREMGRPDASLGSGRYSGEVKG